MMTPEERQIIGEMRSDVKNLQTSQDTLSGEVKEIRDALHTLLGKINEGWHTPSSCTLEKRLKGVEGAVADLQGFKKYVLGMAAVVTFLITMAVQLVKGIFTRGN